MATGFDASASADAGMDIGSRAPGAGDEGEDAGIRVHETGQDVLVHGLGGAADVLRELEDIAAAAERTRSAGQDVRKTARKFDSPDEFGALVQRVKRGEAEVVLRKVFLYRGSCNVEQEIWIKDKGNPDAPAQPHKEYSIVHAHHHARVDKVRDVKPEHLAVVDAMNARHMTADVRGAWHQGDNPFFSTFIEPSGRDTLKVFPVVEVDWKCNVCRQSNWKSKVFCRGKGGSPCSGVRPCAKWAWQQQQSRDEGLAKILECADRALQWASGSGKSMARGGGDAASGSSGSTFVLKDLMQQYKQTRGLRRYMPTNAPFALRTKSCRAKQICLGGF